MRQPSTPPSVAETWLIPESNDSDSDHSDAKDADDGLVGSTLLDTYRIERLLGEGGMGRIYEAHHTRIPEKLFAIKVLRAELVTNKLIRARFEREAEAVARVAHPGIVSIIDVGMTQLGWPYMVCEHLNGLDLLAYLRRFGPLHNDRVVHVGARIAEALAATHAAGVIHRDVKPSNVFLLGAFKPFGPDWDRVKLIDFGLSRFVRRDEQLTEAGIVMGTPAYMAPEQARGGQTNQLTDVYGLGAVLYAAATGVPPFREETPQETLLAVMSREPRPPRAIKPSISEELEIVIQRAMSKQPQERYPSMLVLLRALSRLELGNTSLGNTALGAMPLRVPEVGARGVRLRLLGLGSTALLLAAGAVASAVLGLVALAGERFTLTSTGRVLLIVLLSVATGVLSMWLGSLDRSKWRNTAKLADWLPRLRDSVLCAVVAYGLASFAVRFGSELSSLFAGGALGRAPRVDWPGWSVVLSLLALSVAYAVSFSQRAPGPARPRRRWVWLPIGAACMALAALVLVRWELFARGDGEPLAAADASASSAAAATTIAASTSGSTTTTTSDTTASNAAGTVAIVPPAQVLVSNASASLLQAGGAADAGASAAAAALPLAPAGAEISGVPAALAAPELAPASVSREAQGTVAPPAAREDLTVATAREAGDLKSPLPLAASGEPDVRRILAMAVSGNDDSAQAAFEAMSGAMGSKGPDMLYDLMVTRPALAKRARHQLSRFRVRKLFSPELAIAYELRFSPSCGSRLGLLKQADQVGDQRSINVLSALAGKAPPCGRRGRSQCLPVCEHEAEQFSRSIDTIVRRLRTSEHPASAN